MSCNGYHRLKWYYTYPQHPYKWTSIRGQDLIEFKPQSVEHYCACGQNCQCPCCPYRQQRVRQPQQPVQSQSQAGGCGCSL